MSVIRVGLIGLSTKKELSNTGAWASLAHFPFLAASPHYRVVALLNSTIESAKASIAHHHLGPDVKAYGSPEDLAKDENVDLVVVSVQVDKHYALAKPALMAGKDLFVEWPLGANLGQAEELAELAKAKGVRTVVGLQARPSVVVKKIKEIIDSGKIGRVLSTSVVANTQGFAIGTWPADAEYYLDENSGGNTLTIPFAHFIDSFNLLLGEFTHLQSILKTHHPNVDLVDRAGKITKPGFPKSSPDHILIQGSLTSGAVASVSFRSTPNSVESLGLRWIISGADGEIELTSPNFAWQLGIPGTALKVRLGTSEDVETINVEDHDELKEVEFPGKNVARVYEAFRTGERALFADFEDALVRHRMIDAIRRSAKEERMVRV